MACITHYRSGGSLRSSTLANERKRIFCRTAESHIMSQDDVILIFSSARRDCFYDLGQVFISFMKMDKFFVFEIAPEILCSDGSGES